MTLEALLEDADRQWDLLFGDLATAQMAKVRESIVSLNVSYSTSMCTQLTIELIDPNFEMLKANYFIIGRDIIYRSKVVATNSAVPELGEMNKDKLVHLFEIASVEVRPSPGSSPSISIQARTKAVQQMKRDKNPGNIKGTSSDYVYYVALFYGLTPIVQKTSKTRQITKASGDKQADSTWDVLTRLASDAKFMLFETDGLLFFCSMDYLYGRWGVMQIEHGGFYTNSKNEPVVSPCNVVPLIWPPFSDQERTNLFINGTIDPNRQFPAGLKANPKNAGVLIPSAMPTLRRSDNDPFVVSGSASVDRTAGITLRPGMTLAIAGIPTFEDIYMISDISFNHYSGEPVSIEFTKPEREGKYVQNYAVGPAFADYAQTTESSELIQRVTRAGQG
jgi:hypothetical protein